MGMYFRPHKFDRIKSWLHRKYELLYPAPTESRLVQILGGTTLTIGAMRRNGRPLTVILSRGRLLRSERFRRSVIDDMGVLANDVRTAIALQGPEYESDVVEAFERDEYLASKGWVIRYIPIRWLYENPARVRADVRQFLYQ